MNVQALHMLSKSSTTELYPQPRKSFFFLIQMKREKLQSSVIPKFRTMYGALSVLQRLQNVLPPRLRSSVKSLSTNCYEMEIRRKER